MDTLKDKNAVLEEENANLNEIINVVYSLSSTQISLQRIAHIDPHEVEKLQDNTKFAKEIKPISKLRREGSQEFYKLLSSITLSKEFNCLRKA